MIHHGGAPIKYTSDGEVEIASEARESRSFSTLHGPERPYIMEKAIVGDIALVKAYKVDHWGNVMFNKT